MDIKYHRWLIAQYWLVLETEHFNEQCYLTLHSQLLIHNKIQFRSITIPGTIRIFLV